MSVVFSSLDMNFWIWKVQSILQFYIRTVITSEAHWKQAQYLHVSLFCGFWIYQLFPVDSYVFWFSFVWKKLLFLYIFCTWYFKKENIIYCYIRSSKTDIVITHQLPDNHNSVLPLKHQAKFEAVNIPVFFFLFFRENKSWCFMWIIFLPFDSQEISRLICFEK